MAICLGHLLNVSPRLVEELEATTAKGKKTMPNDVRIKVCDKLE
jgi:hypothetical protein